MGVILYGVLCMYMCVCVYYVCVLVCVIHCMHAHSYARESQQLTSGILLYYSPRYYLRQILSADLEFTDLLGWLTSPSVPRIPLSPSSGAGIIGVCCHTQLLMWILKVSCLHGKQFTPRAVSLASSHLLAGKKETQLPLFLMALLCLGLCLSNYL